MKLVDVIERFNEIVHKGLPLLPLDAKRQEVVDTVNELIDEFRSDPNYSDLVAQLLLFKADLRNVEDDPQ